MRIIRAGEKRPHWVFFFRGATVAALIDDRDVAIRAHADPSAPVVARVSYGLVLEAPTVSNRAGEAGAECPDWTPVFDAEQMLAWVCTTDVRPVSGLYYTFTRLAGGWKLTRIHALAD